MMPDDSELLRRFVRDDAKDAFGELVQRHLGLVYQAALRQVGNPHQAEEVAQEVFTLLARKAPTLVAHPVLIGWLFSTTRQCAWRLQRTEHRRKQREHAAWETGGLDSQPTAENWDKLKPLLDEALEKLKPAERDALLLRFFKEQPFAKIGLQLNMSEDAARMRVERALEKLRTRLMQRGITSTAAALAAILTTNATAAAPNGLATSISTSALAGAAVSGGGLAGIVAKIALMTKTQIAVLCGVLALCVTGVIRQSQQNAVAKLQLATEQRIGAKFQASLAALERDLSATRDILQHPIAPALTPQQQEKKNQSLRLSRKVFDRQYAALYRKLRLSAARLEQFQNLLAEREWDNSVAAQYARKNGLTKSTNRENRQIGEVASTEANAKIRAFLGDANYAYFERYEQTAVMRNVFSRYTEDLKQLSTPLSDEQLDRFADLAYAHMAESLDRAHEEGGLAIPDALIRKAANFLSPGQLGPLQAAQEEFAARRRISVLNREAALQGKLTLTTKTAKYYPDSPVAKD